MFRFLNSRKGQNTAEYAILIGVIVAAAIAMQIYIRRGMQARTKEAVDYTMTADNTIFKQQQYEPYYMQSNFQTQQAGTTSEQMQQGGGVSRESLTDTTTRTGNQVYGNYVAGNTNSV